MKITFIFLVLLFVMKLQGQDKVVLYYNGDWQLTQKEKAVYTREAEYDLEHLRLNGPVVDFDLAGKKMMEGNYTGGKRNGAFTFFFPNGNMESKGSYENNKRIGKWEYFYPTGKPKQLIVYYPTDDQLDNFVVIDYFDRTGNQLVKNGTGKWINDSIKRSLFEPLNPCRITGQFKDSLKVGNWKLIRLSDKKLLHSEQFKKGYFESAVAFSPHSKEYGTVSSEVMQKLPDSQVEKFKNTESFELDTTAFPDSLHNAGVVSILKTITGKKYEIRNRRVMYPEGDFSMMEFIASNIRYPSSAQQRGASGKVYVDASIDSKGDLKEAIILYGAGKDLDNEALRVVRLIKKWLPALQDGVAVDSRLTIPITFKLSE
ncbi:MAG TPA: TonB family protein [Prolixibacteraceae bacterium]|jgi:TonB family protein